MTEKLLSSQEVAEILGIPIATLYQWRYRGVAPRAISVGRHLRYRRTDIDAWIDQHADPEVA